MIDRGWRRSGKYCYKPDLRKSCCPQYTIRLDAVSFKATRSHRKLLYRWNRYILDGEGDTNSMEVDEKRPKGKHLPPFDLSQSLHAAEREFLGETPAKRKFEVILEPSSYSKEKFELYCKYQRSVHQDTDNAISGFKRFLVDTPLEPIAVPYRVQRPSHLPPTYGSYHQLYRVDGRLVAIAVIDVLPHCISSVYFMYDAGWEQFSLGKLSALREVALAKEMHEAGAPGMGYLYMGYYIQTCQKMRYKAEYAPSFLADPETYEWFPIEKCKPLLDKNRYACFSKPEHCISGACSPENAIDEPMPDLREMQDVYVVQPRIGKSLVAVPLPATSQWEDDEIREALGSCIRGLGLNLAEEIIWIPLS